MKAYLFNPETKEFEIEIEAQIDPLESVKQKKEIYLLPANSTYEKPLDEKDGFKVKWQGSSWIYEKIPEPEPEQEPTIEELSAIKRIERNSLLGQTDAKMLPDFPITAEEKELWLLYRQYLRDITKDPAFPNVDVLSFENWLGQIHSKEPVLGAE